MNLFNPPLYFTYLVKHYVKNLVVILLGLSLAISIIDYFQQMQKLDSLGSYQLFYIFYRWENALTTLYPLAIVFAVIMTKMTLVKHSNFVVLHAFGYSKKKLLKPFLFVGVSTYLLFLALHATSFSYAKERAQHLLQNKYDKYRVSDLFFKYNDAFVFIKTLDPVQKKINDLTIFKVQNHQVSYTIHSPEATFNGEMWSAKDAVIKTHIYENGILQRYTQEHKPSMEMLEGYKPKIIESLYEGKSLSIVDAYYAWRLLFDQSLNSNKIRAALYDKVITPLFAIALLLILFFKLPFYARGINISTSVALALGAVVGTWGTLFSLRRVAYGGVVPPEFTSLLPVMLLMFYAIYVYRTQESLQH